MIDKPLIDKTLEESFISPYLERPLRSIEEVLRSLPSERRIALMETIESAAAEVAATPADDVAERPPLKRTA